MSTLWVDSAIAIPPEVVAMLPAILTNVTSSMEQFNSAMVASYKAAEKARTGVEPLVEVQVSSVIDIETPAPPTPPPTPRPTPKPTPRPPPPTTTTTTNATTTTTAAATAAPEEEEEEGSQASAIGAVLGACVGVGVLGGGLYLYKKKQAPE